MRRAVILALVMAVSLLAATRGAAASEDVWATASRLAGDERRTRLVLDLTGPVSARAFLLADPMRVVVDLSAVTFALAPGAGQQARGLVSRFRFGANGPSRSRLVVDLAQTAIIDKTFVIPGSDGQPTRLVLDLVGTGSASFHDALRAGYKPATADGTPVIEASGTDDTSAQPKRPLIVIDPGHGGIDAGATSPHGEQEKSIVLGFARRIQERLTASGNYKVIMTRSDDTFVTLSDRVRMARDAHAALFLSIHADTLPDPFGVRGATIYTLSDTASDADTARYAEKENRADVAAGANLAAEPTDVSDILFDLTKRETKGFSNRFAQMLATDFAAASPLNKNAHRSAGFRVLTAPDVPSVLLELGYLSNPQDMKLLTSDVWGDQASAAVASAIDHFFGQEGVASATVAPELAVAGLSVVKAAVSP